jgi:hypothetical protein
MQTSADLHAPCSPAELFAHVADLEQYPDWMTLVHSAHRSDSDPEGVCSGVAAWVVELRTRVGPLARSKRLRMIRTQFVENQLVVFEREELDGRQHSPWVLRVEIESTSSGAALVMHLTYGGSLWTGGILQKILEDEIRRGSRRLLELVSDGPTR